MATGAATLDFGPATTPNTEAAVVVTGQTALLAGSQVEVWVQGATTSDHSEDEHRVEALKVTVGTLVAGTGFTISGECLLGTTYGVFTCQWVWL